MYLESFKWPEENTHVDAYNQKKNLSDHGDELMSIFVFKFLSKMQRKLTNKE